MDVRSYRAARFWRGALGAAFGFIAFTPVAWAQEATPAAVAGAEEPKPEEPKPEQPKAEEPKAEAPKPEEKAKEAAWYERFSLRGYTQVRYERVYGTGDFEEPPTGGFVLRRARLILFGDVTPFLFVYLQPDFAAGIGGDRVGVAQIRDWYADIAVDAAKEFRFRVGQSKVPFGFENMQSSSNRLPLDRSAALNSAVPGERDLGAFFYWAPAEIRQRFAALTRDGFKGSGDYGVIGIGAYDGQTINRREANTNRHVIAHVAWPFLIGEQYLEVGASAYTGVFTVRGDGELVPEDVELRDQRAGGYLVIYPQPIGLQAEYNAGRGPRLTDAGMRARDLQGGYVLVSADLKVVIPFVRFTLYDGGDKNDLSVRYDVLREVEGGVEVHLRKWVELTAAVNSTRTRLGKDGAWDGEETVRLQLQFNY